MSDYFYLEKKLNDDDKDGLTYSVGVQEIVNEHEQGRWKQREDGTGEFDWIPKEIEQPNITVYSHLVSSDEEGELYKACTIRVIANVKLREKSSVVRKVMITIPLTTLEMKEIIAKAEGENK